MNANTIPISQARANLPQLINDTSVNDVFITVKGKIKAALVDANEYVQLLETLEVLSDKETLKNLEKGQQEANMGQVVDWSDLKKTLKTLKNIIE